MIFLAKYLEPDSAVDVLLNHASPIPLHSLGAILAIMLGAVQLSFKKFG